MGDQAKAPEVFTFHGDVGKDWKLWKQKFELYLVASGKSDKKDNVKIAILLNFLGDEGLRIFNTFEYSDEEDEKKLSTILDKFDKYCQPIKNLVYEHFIFFKREQLQGESIDQFVTALRQLASTCDFKEKDVLIRDRLVLGVKDSRIQEKLLQYPNLGLSDAISICRSMEASVATQKEIVKEAANVDAIKKQGVNNYGTMSARNCNGCCVRVPNRMTSANHSAANPVRVGQKPLMSTRGQISTTPSAEYQGNSCLYCGMQHPRGKCPAFNRFCSSCGQKGHYRRFCTNRRNIHEITESFNETVGFKIGRAHV